MRTADHPIELDDGEDAYDPATAGQDLIQGGDNVDDDEEVYGPGSAFQDVGTSNSSKAAKKQRVGVMASAPGTASNDPQFSDDDDSPRNAPIRSKNQGGFTDELAMLSEQIAAERAGSGALTEGGAASASTKQLMDKVAEGFQNLPNDISSILFGAAAAGKDSSTNTSTKQKIDPRTGKPIPQKAPPAPPPKSTLGSMSGAELLAMAGSNLPPPPAQHSKTESKAGKGLPNRPPPSAGPFSSPPAAWRGEGGGGGPPQGPPPGYTSGGPGSGPSQSQQPGPWMKGFEPPPPPSIRNSTGTPPVRTHQESGPIRTSGPIWTHDPWGRDGAKGGRDGGGGYRDMDFRESSSAGGDKHGVDPWQRGSGDRDRDYRNSSSQGYRTTRDSRDSRDRQRRDSGGRRDSDRDRRDSSDRDRRDSDRRDGRSRRDSGGGDRSRDRSRERGGRDSMGRDRGLRRRSRSRSRSPRRDRDSRRNEHDRSGQQRDRDFRSLTRDSKSPPPRRVSDDRGSTSKGGGSGAKSGSPAPPPEQTAAAAGSSTP